MVRPRDKAGPIDASGADWSWVEAGVRMLEFDIALLLRQPVKRGLETWFIGGASRKRCAMKRTFTHRKVFRNVRPHPIRLGRVVP